LNPERVVLPGYRPTRSGFNSRLYKIFLDVVGLEVAYLLGLVSTLEKLLERKRTAVDD
jgi:hypothetical protein